ncbi:fam-l protein [Plasmodium malariae]|uniref:Fam-l protein n=1 Tax=Plasmodium malariae TaxID=5858 RepID=A0A1D3JHQ5_PLAMA|nr:fam-l protein [Plasmodium malariae]SBT85947.1 fam-l protein [Plasmodium malariae]
MEQKFKLLLFSKVFTFILLSWIYHFYIYKSTHNKSFVEYCKNHRKLYIRNYRLLAKYNNDKDSSVVCLKKEIPVGVNNKNDITYIEKESTTKNKASNRYAPRNARGNKKCMKNKSCIFEMKKYSHLEKKIFKELDYVDFLKKNKTISDKIYKKIIRKKCGLRFALPLLLILVLLVSFILDNVGGYGLTFGLFKLIVFLFHLP